MTVRLLATVMAIASIPAVAFGPMTYAQQILTTKTVWAGVYTKDQAARGQPLYAARCGACHGPLMEGGEMAPALAGPTFLGNWNGLTVGDLFDRTRTTMPLDDPGSLSRAQFSEVTAYILSTNRFPSGDTDLDTRVEALKQIQIQAYKP